MMSMKVVIRKKLKFTTEIPSGLKKAYLVPSAPCPPTHSPARLRFYFGLGLRLQLRAIASRWNFLTNTGRTGRSSPGSARQGVPFLSTLEGAG